MSNKKSLPKYKFENMAKVYYPVTDNYYDTLYAGADNRY